MVRTAVVTGASSGIGEAAARALAREGFAVVLGARRLDRCASIAAEIGGRALSLDVTSEESVAQFAAQLPNIDVLVNNAGGARGLNPISDTDIDDWRWMWETNVLGTMRVTRAALPRLLDSDNPMVITVTSTAALEVYPGGAGYTSAKHAQRTLHRILESELAHTAVRFTEISPGVVETDFSLNRFKGDQEQANAVYAGLTPLSAADIAEVIAFAVTGPEHVTLQHLVVRPRAQADSTTFFREAPNL